MEITVTLEITVPTRTICGTLPTPNAKLYLRFEAKSTSPFTVGRHVPSQRYSSQPQPFPSELSAVRRHPWKLQHKGRNIWNDGSDCLDSVRIESLVVWTTDHSQQFPEFFRPTDNAACGMSCSVAIILFAVAFDTAEPSARTIRFHTETIRSRRCEFPERIIDPLELTSISSRIAGP